MHVDMAGGKPSASDDYTITNVIIYKAQDLSGIDFACWTNMVNGKVTMMDRPIYVGNQETLILHSYGGIKIRDLHNIHYGNSKKGDVNLCMNDKKNKYRII